MTASARHRGFRRAKELSTSVELIAPIGIAMSLVIATISYVAMSDLQVLSTRLLVYPILWIALSSFLVLYLYRRGPTIRASKAAMLVGGGYFLLLAVVGGLLWPSHALLGHHHHGGGLTVHWAPPGWGPTVLYGNELVQLAVVPFKLIAFAALAYGVAAAVAASSRGVVAGFLGLFSCVGCLLPLAAIVVGLVGSGSTSLAAIAGSYDISTVVFILTVVLLATMIPTE